MDKIALLRKRKEELFSAGVSIRAEISSLCDAESFVELSAFSYSDTFSGEEARGEGVVTGFATIGGYPFYLVAQNFAVSYGGLSKGNCEKIAKTLDAAERSGTPVVYLLQSQGVRVGEGVDVLEGIGALLSKATELKGNVMQFAVLLGGVYGSSAALASLCDFVLFTKKGSLSLTSPLVLAAGEGKDVPKEFGGYSSLKGAVLPAIEVEDVKEAASVILRISDFLELPVIDAELNDPAPALNDRADAASVRAVLENAVEIGGNSCPEVSTLLARVGGISVAAVLFDEARLNERNVKKLKSFAEFACYYSLPFVLFVDCDGVEKTASANDSALFKEIGDYLSVLGAIECKIAVVTGKAIGLGYSLLASKSVGFDYCYALATAQISLFESEQGAQIELGNLNGGEEAAARYRDESGDPVHAAKGGYLDNIIEPQFLKQYLVASLQTLRK